MNNLNHSISQLSETAKVLHLATDKFLAALDDTLPVVTEEDVFKCPCCDGSGIGATEYAIGRIIDVDCASCHGKGEMRWEEYQGALTLNTEILFKACSLEAMVEGPQC